MKFSVKMRLKTILKVTKYQGFTLSLEDTFFKKPQGEGSNWPSPPQPPVILGLSISHTLESSWLPTSPFSVSKRLIDLRYAVVVSAGFLNHSCPGTLHAISFLMRPSPSLVLSFGTSDFAFIAGLLPSCLLLFVSALFCSCCTSFINEWSPWGLSDC